MSARHRAFKKRHPMRRAALFLGLAGLAYAARVRRAGHGRVRAGRPGHRRPGRRQLLRLADPLHPAARLRRLGPDLGRPSGARHEGMPSERRPGQGRAGLGRPLPPGLGPPGRRGGLRRPGHGSGGMGGPAVRAGRLADALPGLLRGRRCLGRPEIRPGREVHPQEVLAGGGIDRDWPPPPWPSGSTSCSSADDADARRRTGTRKGTSDGGRRSGRRDRHQAIPNRGLRQGHGALGRRRPAPETPGPGQPGEHRPPDRAPERPLPGGRNGGGRAGSSGPSWRPTTAGRAGSTGWPSTRP